MEISLPHISCVCTALIFYNFWGQHESSLFSDMLSPVVPSVERRKENVSDNIPCSE